MADKIVFRYCEDESCQNPIYVHNRKLCWSCINFKKRYGLTKTGLIKQRKEAGKICWLCETFRHKTVEFKNKTLCLNCSRFLYSMKTQIQKDRLNNLM